MPGRPLRPTRRAPGGARSVVSTVPALAVATVAILLLAGCMPPRSADAVPAGTIVFDSSRNGPNFEIYAMASDGSNLVQLTDDPTYDSWWPRLSPDRHTILFYRTPAGVHDHDYTRTELWQMAADGSSQQLKRAAGTDGWHFQGHGDWSPDGSQLVMFGGPQTGPQIWITDVIGQDPVLVKERPGTNVDPTWGDDGRIAFVGCAQAWCMPTDYEVFLLDPETGAETQLTDDDLRDHDPALSPDGSRVAWLTQLAGGGWDLQVANSDGSNARRVFGTVTMVGAPMWQDDTHFLVHKVVPPGGYQIHRVDAVTLRVVNLTPNWPGSNEYPAT